jgi:tryptophan synthase alpha chain
MSPTTTEDRQKYISKISTGFIYFVSVTGVTGSNTEISKDVLSKVINAKKITNKPICVGFGISTPEQVRTISKIADGVIVGSAIVKEIDKHRNDKNFISHITKFASRMTKEL